MHSSIVNKESSRPLSWVIEVFWSNSLLQGTPPLKFQFLSSHLSKITLICSRSIFFLLSSSTVMLMVTFLKNTKVKSEQSRVLWPIPSKLLPPWLWELLPQMPQQNKEAWWAVLLKIHIIMLKQDSWKVTIRRFISYRPLKCVQWENLRVRASPWSVF